jgi:hypothetical protein
MALKAKEFNFDDDRMRVIQEQSGNWEPSQHSLKQGENQEKPGTNCRSQCFDNPSYRRPNREYPKVLQNILLSLASMYGTHGLLESCASVEVEFSDTIQILVRNLKKKLRGLVCKRTIPTEQS